MNKELFGVFGDRDALQRFRSPEQFDVIVEGPTMAVGVRDSALGTPGRSTVHETARGMAVVWGEAFVDGTTYEDPARLLVETAGAGGRGVFDRLNGSFLAVVDLVDGPQVVVNDPIRSRECFYTDEPGVRVFGTDPATVASVVDDPEVRSEPLMEFLIMGVVLGDRTILHGVDRVPFDAVVTAEATDSLARFVYDPRKGNHATELGERLSRALERRAGYAGKKGLLLSSGCDSRTVLAGAPDIDVCYTIGTGTGDDIDGAKKIATQYDTPHETLTVDDRYLNTCADVVQYSSAIWESVHIHHAGYVDQMDVDVIYHGGLGDSLFRGHFQPLDGIRLGGCRCPPYSVAENPNLSDYVSQTFGYIPIEEHLSVLDDDCSERFACRRIRERLSDLSWRYDGSQNGLAAVGLENTPTLSFRAHLADTFVESLVMADAELLQWHLQTPPSARSDETYVRALRTLDADILRHRPPNLRFDSFTLSQLDAFLRQKLPLTKAYEGPWPDREVLYEKQDLDNKLLAGFPQVHDLPWRLKLRINDLATWLEHATGEIGLTPTEMLQVDDRTAGCNGSLSPQ
ncbi:asparagine synthase-related protein [Haloarculaceae archaeon H-GB2-1]|nr:asparagine synthase-related protein [Haloarculaceae archaeon H-GB1-1]MEA5408402.1 asparagine synthase-related protein [Haloarculaceae archaeon H-GB2-1]